MLRAPVLLPLSWGVVASAACSHQTLSWERCVDAKWYSPPPFSEHYMVSEEYEIDFREVSASSGAAAVRRLEATSILHLAEEDQGDLLFGVPVAELPPRADLYLVRALYMVPETGGFSVYWNDRKLWVDHSCLGRSFRAMERTALIVALPETPAAVWVTSYMDE